MNNPFKKGDTVYISGNNNPLTVSSVHNMDVKLGGENVFHISEVSFEPWPKAVHTRPIPDGWVIVNSLSLDNAVYYKEGDILYNKDGVLRMIGLHSGVYKITPCQGNPFKKKKNDG